MDARVVHNIKEAESPLLGLRVEEFLVDIEFVVVSQTGQRTTEVLVKNDVINLGAVLDRVLTETPGPKPGPLVGPRRVPIRMVRFSGLIIFISQPLSP